jgi:adenylate kinase
VPAATPFRVVLLGPPASGKGTQGRRLADALGLDYLSTGALLREAVGNGSDLGRQAGPILARGEYLPDALMFPILADWLDRHSGGWVLDGFPRSVPQAEFLDQWLAHHGSKLDAAISLEVPFEELLDRTRKRVECPRCRWTGQIGQLTATGMCPECGGPAGPRADDDEENFRSRHREFVAITGPVVAHYEAAGVLIRCAATAALDDVAADLLQIFQPNRSPGAHS